MIKDFAINTLFRFAAAGGEYVSKDHGDARVEVCKGCEFYGKVEPEGLLIVDGCTKCGCPSSTKPYMKSLPRPDSKLGTELTLEELISLKMSSREVIEGYKSEIMVCPHPDGNKWELIDNKF